jgi:cell division protease FtsH
MNGMNGGRNPRNRQMPEGKQLWGKWHWFILIGAGLMLLYSHFMQPKEGITQFSYSEFLEEARREEIAEVTFQGDKISGLLKDGKKFESSGPYNPDFIRQIAEKKNIKVWTKSASPGFLASWLPTLFFILLLIWIFRRQSQGGGMFGGGIFGFGKSRPKLSHNDQTVTFVDVAGADEAKEELKEVVEFLKNPAGFNNLGAKIPKGILLMGPPGTGKTLLARAVAGEAGVPFLTISGSDFVEMFVGVGASRVRDLFNQAKAITARNPCIIFVDEIDAVGRHRGAGLGGGHDEREQTLNQIFVEMDGFEANIGIIVMAATNRPDVLDPALLRPGRFDRHVTVGLPDVNGREAILKIHVKGKILAPETDLRVIARGTPMFSGADLANLVNEAALLAGRSQKKAIEMIDFEKAKDRVMMGAERKSFKMSEREKEITAYHEAGHVLVAKMTSQSDPVHKVSIIPRGRALGVTMQLPLEDRYLISKSYALGQLRILMGGRAAELIKFSEVSSGAQNDIQVATNLAEKMLCLWGMNDDLGPVTWSKEHEDIFLGRQIVQSRGYSEATGKKIDAEKKKIISESMTEAEKIIKENRGKFEALVKVLLEKETLEEEEINKILE